VLYELIDLHATQKSSQACAGGSRYATAKLIIYATQFGGVQGMQLYFDN